NRTEATFYRVGAGYQLEAIGVPSNWATFPGIHPDLVTLGPWIGEFDAAGNYWAAGNVSGPAVMWAKIDMDPASPTYFEVIDAGTAPSPGGWTTSFDWGYNVDTGDLYSIGHQAGDYELLRFDTTTHTIHEVAYIGPMSNPNGGGTVSQFGAAYTDADGFLYSSDNTTGGIWRTDMSTGDTVFFAQGPASGQNDGARCFNAGLPIDMGDAPASYGTTLDDDGPRHGIVGYDETTNSAPLMLGSSIDAEFDGVPSVDADGDDLADIADEDGVTAQITLTPTGATVNVDVTNDTGGNATLAGWIDLDGNGTFDPSERVTTTVTGSGTYTLNFPAGSITTDTYARFRLYEGDVADPLPIGAAGNGEVEDYTVVYHDTEVVKSSNPAAGTPVAAGETVTYTITFT
ncbi:MAG: GEVED domain-containing protein, partial [Ilumatobacter fluminis]